VGREKSADEGRLYADIRTRAFVQTNGRWHLRLNVSWKAMPSELRQALGVSLEAISRHLCVRGSENGVRLEGKHTQTVSPARTKKTWKMLAAGVRSSCSGDPAKSFASRYLVFHACSCARGRLNIDRSSQITRGCGGRAGGGRERETETERDALDRRSPGGTRRRSHHIMITISRGGQGSQQGVRGGPGPLAAGCLPPSLPFHVSFLGIPCGFGRREKGEAISRAAAEPRDRRIYQETFT
jgi:hypothetical protein